MAVLSDRNIVKSSDAKNLDMRDEYWQLMEELLPVLEPLQIATELLCADTMPSSSVVIPVVQKLITADLVDKSGDSAACLAFKMSMRSSLATRFAIDDVNFVRRCLCS